MTRWPPTGLAPIAGRPVRFALDIQPDYITWFVDGVETYQVANPVQRGVLPDHECRGEGDRTLFGRQRRSRRARVSACGGSVERQPVRSSARLSLPDAVCGSRSTALIVRGTALADTWPAMWRMRSVGTLPAANHDVEARHLAQQSVGHTDARRLLHLRVGFGRPVPRAPATPSHRPH